MTPERALKILAMSEQERRKNEIYSIDVDKAVETIRNVLPKAKPEILKEEVNE